MTDTHGGAAACLVADDHPALRAALAACLEDAGFAVVGSVGDGTSAIEAAARERPALAIVDLRMPGPSGVTLVEQLQAVAPEMRVLVYTADVDEQTAGALVTAGASGVLLKESSLDDLIGALETIAGGGSYRSRAVVNARHDLRLTDRERGVLALVAEGLPLEEIAARLGISIETVRTHLKNASDRLGATTRTQAVATALRLGLID